ncbi:hypothetical protein HK414_15840 [Ramlibacter terrae]|uniref:Uncharacterized protein n=1 Tax=Ramlibacter terrae TaxID=2732511 RepID=A0ABX6P3D3_9BURK|nr:hypothetical protein HK414_15840 [Ramlibacter terrae]
MATADSALTRVCSEAPAAPMLPTAVSTAAAVSPSRLAAVPVRPSMIAPAELIVIVPSAAMTLTVTLPWRERRVTLPLSAPFSDCATTPSFITSVVYASGLTAPPADWISPPRVIAPVVDFSSTTASPSVTIVPSLVASSLVAIAPAAVSRIAPPTEWIDSFTVIVAPVPAAGERTRRCRRGRCPCRPR